MQSLRDCPWYHPHSHGFSARQVSGGLSGALIVEGIERDRPGLAEHVLVIRDQDLLKPDAVVAGNAAATLVDREGDIMNTGTGDVKPARDLSVNFVPVPFSDYAPATMVMRPGEQQLWRVLNALAVTYLNLAATLRRGARFPGRSGSASWPSMVPCRPMAVRLTASNGATALRYRPEHAPSSFSPRRRMACRRR